MLSVILACDDPHETADLYTERLGWQLVFATPRDSGDPLVCVALGDAEIMPGVAEERFLPAASRAHRGAGVSIYMRLPEGEDIAAIQDRHATAGAAVH
jgi:catechol 2,3-dioxygenase-like lactoylglutathione lyase family enzyme